MNIQSTYDNILKIIFLGDSGVGKSNFLFRFVEGKFAYNSSATIGLNYKSKLCTLPKSKKKVLLQLWDTAGQEKYMSITKIFFQKVQGIVLMYDITKRESYEKLPKWVQIIKETTYDVPVLLLGNKIDDEDENRIVRTQEGQNFAKDNGYLFYETSALTGKNVNHSIYDLCESVMSIYEIKSNEEAFGRTLENLKGPKKKDPALKSEKCC